MAIFEEPPVEYCDLKMIVVCQMTDKDEGTDIIYENLLCLDNQIGKGAVFSTYSRYNKIK